MSIETSLYLPDLYACDGYTTEFSISFETMLDDDGDARFIKVFLVNDLDERTELTEDVHYTISGLKITTIDTYSSDYKILITLDVDLKQLISFITLGKVDPRVVEEMGDKLTLVQHELEELLSRSIHFAPQVEDHDSELPVPVDLAGAFLAGDANGKKIVAAPGSITGLPVTEFARTLLDDVAASEARGTLDVYSQDEVEAYADAVASSEADAAQAAAEATAAAALEAESKKPPIGIPTMWFTSVVPDWAIAFDDGSGPYDWVDYPEFDNATFKAMLTIWSTAGWMSAHDETSFYVPDLQGMFARIAGTNGVYGSGIHAGGSVGDYTAHQLQDHGHNHRHLAWSNNDDHAHSPYDTAQGTSYDTSNGYRIPTSYDAAVPSSGNHGAETRPCSFSVKIIVRFE